MAASTIVEGGPPGDGPASTSTATSGNAVRPRQARTSRRAHRVGARRRHAVAARLGQRARHGMVGHRIPTRPAADRASARHPASRRHDQREGARPEPIGESPRLAGDFGDLRRLCEACADERHRSIGASPLERKQRLERGLGSRIDSQAVQVSVGKATTWPRRMASTADVNCGTSGRSGSMVMRVMQSANFVNRQSSIVQSSSHSRRPLPAAPSSPSRALPSFAGRWWQEPAACRR